MPQEPLFLPLSDTKSLNYLEDVGSAKASYNNRTFEDFDGNISVKSTYDRKDFEYFRGQTGDLNEIEQMKIAQKAYEKVSIVRNFMDVMANLTGQGVRLEHRDKKKERFYQAWFDVVNGEHVTERFSSMLYRLCNVPILTAYGKVLMPEEENLSKSTGGIHDATIIEHDVRKKNIPLRYTFVDPSSVEVVGGSAGLLLGKQCYALKIGPGLLADISKVAGSPNKVLSEEYRILIEKLKEARQKNGNYLEIDQDKFDIYYYKKDDWKLWATPITSCILNNLITLERMQLADLSALDGAISNVRHWVVGILDPNDLKKSIMPTKAAINKIKSIVANGVGGGTMDLVTGPEVSFKESATTVHQFLGSEKYKTTLDLIYDGLGIPPPLRGNSGSSNSSNNYVSLKTLIEQLRYGRSILERFWNKQIKIVQEAMGHKYPAKVTFDETILSDEAAEKTLLIKLWEHELIDADAVVRYFGLIPEITQVKVQREHKARKDGRLPPKASQYHQPQPEQDYIKGFIQQGILTPSEVGVELDDKHPEQKIPLELEKKFAPKPAPGAGVPAKKKKKLGIPGRTPGTKETKKRKPKPNQKPRTSAEMVIWATKAYAKIHDILSPALLSAYGKDNYRKLTKDESNEAEVIKFGVLSAMVPFSDITPEVVNAYISVDNPISDEIDKAVAQLTSNFIKENDRQPTLDEVRQIQILSFVEVNSEENIEESE